MGVLVAAEIPGQAAVMVVLVEVAVVATAALAVAVSFPVTEMSPQTTFVWRRRLLAPPPKPVVIVTTGQTNIRPSGVGSAPMT